MKRIIAALALVALATPAVAGDTLSYTKLFDDEAVASTGSATTAVFQNRRYGGVESLLLLASSASGTADVKIELVICEDAACAVTGAAADFTDLLDSSNTTCPVSEGLCRILMPTVGAPAFKLTVTGVGSNNADTVVDLGVVARGFNK